MKNFDLEAAKRGAAVCTRDGRSARIICFDVDNIEYSIVANVRSGKQLKSESAQLYCRSGKWYPATAESGSDLMMRDDDYLEKLERGEYDHIADASKMVEPNEFEKHPRLAEYIRTMAATGQIPSGWSGFIAALNESLSRSSDREYWRRVYAGQIAGGLASHNGLNIIGSEIIIAKASCNIADALIDELEKPGPDCSKGNKI